MPALPLFLVSGREEPTARPPGAAGGGAGKKLAAGAGRPHPFILGARDARCAISHDNQLETSGLSGSVT